MPKHKVRTYKSIQTLAGPVRYIDSGWNTQEWDLIRMTMARCNTGAQNLHPLDPEPEPLLFLCPFCGGESTHHLLTSDDFA